MHPGKQVLRSGISFPSAWLQSLFCASVFQLGVSLGTLGAIPAAALDPNITALGEIPQPPIMGNVDPSKIDEIRRTVYVGNLNSQVALFCFCVVEILTQGVKMLPMNSNLRCSESFH